MPKAITFSKLDDWINPIAVKEMRQAVKGRLISWVLVIFLLIQLIIIATVLVFTEDVTKNTNLGRETYMGLLGLLLGTCLLVIPAVTAFRLSSERSDTNVDLFFLTALSPMRIIWGKLSGALVVTLLFFSAALPFMTLTYLLRGLDLPSMFISWAFDFLIVVVCIQFGITLACIPGKILGKGFMFLVGFGALSATFSMSMAFSGGMLFSGLGSGLGSWEFWGPALSVVALIIIGLGLLYILAVTMITPASANRALGVRIYLLFIWIATGALAVYWAWDTGDEEIIYAWIVMMVVMFSILLFASVCERQHLGPRITRKIPRRLIFRIPAFFIFSGAAGGIALSLLMIVLTIMTGYAIMLSQIHTSRWHSFDDEFFLRVICISLYAFCYFITALNLQRLLSPNKPGFSNIGLITGALFLVGTAIPAIIGFMLKSKPYEDVNPMWYIANPFVVLFERNMHYDALIFTGIWASGLLAVTLPWFAKQVLNFKPITINSPTKDGPEQIEANDE
jgi:hypothetical protein